MTESLWSLLRKKDVSWDSKLEAICDFMLQIKCRNGTDSTFKVALAIVQNLHEKEMTPSEAYIEINRLKTKMHQKRLLNPGEQSMLIFPKDVNDFLKIWPRTYQDCDPPIASKIDDLRIMEATRKDVMPTRKSNASVSSAASGSGAVANRSTGMDSTGVELAKMCMGWMMGTSPNNPTPFFGDAQGRRQRINRPTLAIADNNPLAIMDAPLQITIPPQHAAVPSPNRDNLPVPAAVPDGGDANMKHPVDGAAIVPAVRATNVADLIMKGRLALGKAAGGKKKKGSKAENLPSEPEDSDEASACGDAKPAIGEGAHESSSEDEPMPKAKAEVCLKRPAASVKTPVLKRPAAAMEPVAELPPKVAKDCEKPPPSTSPTSYRGGKIYYNTKKSTLRVYRRRGDTVERAIKVDATDKKLYKKAWTWALNEIISDPRPFTE
jgi:hypothetical protein